ncbi:MAG TPA: creatininase family protein [Solirubrobacteraceae bacterium]|nr:creatininase family protein [Solirubrobacteraceae bacterium]
MRELELLTAPALRRLLEGGTSTVIVPFGSIEDQNGHLPLGADSVLADLVGREVAMRLDAVLAPSVRVGAGDGTLSVETATLAETALGLAESLAASGFRLIVLVPIHGGNVEPLNVAVARFNERAGPAWACAPRGDVGPDPGNHSGKWLTSVMLAFRPELVDVPAASASLRAELEGVDAESGVARFERFVSAIVEQTTACLHRRASRPGAPPPR